jgi:predicted polyphosphate/ATP-dependent NAD kinase
MTAPRVGLLVNPIAGIGGRVGLAGSDGAEIVEEALARGAIPRANDRTVGALEILRARWAAARSTPVPIAAPILLAAPGDMGAIAARRAGFAPLEVGAIGEGPTTAADTRRLAEEIIAAGIDLLLFAGGDGTARDICGVAAAAGIPVLGIPAGVKIQSAVFATSPAAAGELAAAFLSLPPERRRTTRREVLDLDEAAYRRGEVAPRLFGELAVPDAGRWLQARKAPSPASEVAAARAIGAEVAAGLVAGTRYVLGPGSTMRPIAEQLGVAKTLIGVDVIELDAAGRPCLLASDVGDARLAALVEGRPARVVVTPIGGQGFLFGRGNQPIGPDVLRMILGRGGREAIMVVATPAKLAALGGRPLLVDTGDAALDRDLAGYLRVVTGRAEQTPYPVEPA